MSLRYVALGDSHAEGIGDDAHPDGSPRGWADRLADLLATREDDLHYANLAVRGQRVAQIIDTQLAAAVLLEPQLVVVSAGGNDVLRPDFSRPEYVASLAALVAPLVATGAQVLLMPAPPIGTLMPLGRLSGIIDRRIEVMNDALHSVAGSTGAVVPATLTAAAAVSFTDLGLWSPDRLHLNARGHDRLAHAVASSLGIQTEEAWTPPTGRRRPSLRSDALWWSGAAAPWVMRRVRWRSSGDGRVAKRPDLDPWAAPAESEPAAG